MLKKNMIQCDRCWITIDRKKERHYQVFMSNEVFTRFYCDKCFGIFVRENSEKAHVNITMKY